MNSAFVPRAWSALVALLCVGALMWLAIANETPTGAVRGRVVLAENKIKYDQQKFESGCDVRVSAFLNMLKLYDRKSHHCTKLYQIIYMQSGKQQS